LAEGYFYWSVCNQGGETAYKASLLESIQTFLGLHIDELVFIVGVASNIVERLYRPNFYKRTGNFIDILHRQSSRRLVLMMILFLSSSIADCIMPLMARIT
jgi:hypothetical protein